MSKQAWGHHQARSHQRVPNPACSPTGPGPGVPSPVLPTTSEGPCLTSFKHEGGRCLVINRTGSKSLELLRWKRLAQGRECSVPSSGSTAVWGPLPPHLWDHEDATGLCPSCPAESHRGKGCPPRPLDLLILYIFRNDATPQRQYRAAAKAPLKRLPRACSPQKTLQLEGCDVPRRWHPGRWLERTLAAHRAPIGDRPAGAPKGRDRVPTGPKRSSSSGRTRSFHFFESKLCVVDVILCHLGV